MKHSDIKMSDLNNLKPEMEVSQETSSFPDEAKRGDEYVIEKTCMDMAKNRFTSIFSNLYKQTGNKLSQEERRKELLSNIKLRRNQFLNESRGIDEIIEENCVNEITEENSAFETNDPPEVKRSYRNRRFRKQFTEQLMLSEWLVDVPLDFEPNWLVKLCPVGTRRLVIAKHGITLGVNKYGFIKHRFFSLLPGGCTRHPTKSTILDCIYDHSLQTYFVLDILNWNSRYLEECETDFRFFFLTSKLNEMPEINTYNKIKFIEIEHFPAERLLIENKISEQFTINNSLLKLDGILFYHKETPYIKGVNALFEWLKPSMLPEKLQISVPDCYMINDMEVCQEYRNKKKQKKKGTEVKMEM